jgi:uncharacterized protein DUF4388
MQSGETGMLVLHNGDITKSVYLSSGRVVFAASNDPNERLGESLLIRGRITARHYLEASRLIRPGHRLGAILVEMNALDGDDLIPAVQQQVEDILLDLFTWSTGDYEFVMKKSASDIVALNISAENLILEGIRRSRNWGRILKGIRGVDSVPVRTSATAPSYKLELTAEEQEVLSHVNGLGTIEQICEVSYLTSFETCRTLWAFQVLGLIRHPQAGDAAAAGQQVQQREQEMDLERVVEQFNQMFTRIYTFLKGRMGDVGTDAFMSRALDEVSRQYGQMFAGVDLRSYGRADYETMLANVADLPADQRRSLMVTGLNELVFVIQLAVRTERGKEEETVVSGIIKEGFKRIGPS